MKPLKRLLAKKEFAFIKKVLSQYPKAEVFLVGGIIRDIILKRESKDYDFIIRNVPAKGLQQLLKKLGWVDLVGKNFGVFKFIPKQFERLKQLKHYEPFDIALPRTEHAFLTGGYRDFTVQSDPKLPIEKDLQRRDFTINALAYNINKNELIDLFNGLGDLKKKIIRTVGQPEHRFKEDYSRILRALRFSCQLGFTIEKQTWMAIKKLMPKINDKKDGEYIVPRETIAKEMAKAFMSNPAEALTLFEQAGAVKELMPELLKMKGCPQPKNFHSEGDVWEHTVLCLKNLASKKYLAKFGKEKPSPELVFGLLFHDLGKPYTIEKLDRLRFNNHDSVGGEKAKEIMERLKLSNAGLDIERTVWLIKRHMLVTHTKGSAMKKTTLEKYFYNDQLPGADLMKLTFADIQATVPEKGSPDFSGFRRLEKQILALKKIARQKKALPKEIINGHEIMKQFILPPGPQIGNLKNLLREEQLKGKIKNKIQAISFLKKQIK